jgi:hypothetical protein
MAHDDTFWGGLGQRVLFGSAFVMGALVATPTLLLLAAPFFL